MHGFGRVYQMFNNFDDFQDDEVAMLHEAGSPYRAASEPLVHLRAAIHAFVQGKLLSRENADTVCLRLKAQWFGDRTIDLFETELVAAADSENVPCIRKHLRDFSRFRVKSLDLIDFARDYRSLQNAKY